MNEIPSTIMLMVVYVILTLINKSDPKRRVMTKMIGFYPVAGNACAVYKNSGLPLPL